jgi:hypothetical protein
MVYLWFNLGVSQKSFEDTEWVINSCILKYRQQYNDPKEKVDKQWSTKHYIENLCLSNTLTQLKIFINFIPHFVAHRTYHKVNTRCHILFAILALFTLLSKTKLSCLYHFFSIMNLFVVTLLFFFPHDIAEILLKLAVNTNQFQCLHVI